MFKAISLAVIVALLSACTSHTEYGQCVGIADQKDPQLTYKLSAWNLVMGAVFFEAIVPPIVVLADETFCPVGKKS